MAGSTHSKQNSQNHWVILLSLVKFLFSMITVVQRLASASSSLIFSIFPQPPCEADTITYVDWLLFHRWEKMQRKKIPFESKNKRRNYEKLVTAKQQLTNARSACAD